VEDQWHTEERRTRAHGALRRSTSLIAIAALAAVLCSGPHRGPKR